MPNDDWGAWSSTIVSETDDAEWLSDTKRAVAKSMATWGRELTTHAAVGSAVVAMQTHTVADLDEKFGADYPDLMATEMGQYAVRVAISKVIGDQRFQRLMQNRATRPRAFAVVAKLANHELGRSGEARPRTSTDPQERDAAAMQEVFTRVLQEERGMGSAERPHGRMPGDPSPRDREARDEVLSHALETGRGPGGTGSGDAGSAW